MHSSYQISETEHQQQRAILLSMNQTHILEQTQQLFLNPPQFAAPHHHQTTLNHHYDVGGAAAAAYSSFLPVNFKLGLNEIYQGENALFHGSEVHCWQNQPLRKSVAETVSNESTDRQETNLKEALKYRLESKSRALYGELEEVYKNFTIAEIDQTRPCQVTPSEASIGEAPTMRNGQRKRRKKKKKETIPVAQFFEHLVNQMTNHQENLQRRFSERIERLDEERRAREEAWRNQERARFELEADARAREKALQAGREATIFSYLEKITGQKFSHPSASNPSQITSINDFH